LIPLTKNIKLYAKLLLSVGQQGRGVSQKQPLQPVPCAELIKRLMDEENEDKSQIVGRLDLGRPKEGTSIYKKRDTTQLNKFLALLEISGKSRDFAGWGWEGYPKIPFSTVSELKSLSHEEQDVVLQSVFKRDTKEKELMKSDARDVTTFRKQNPDLSIQDCIEKVLKLKSVTETTHIVVCETYAKLKNFIKSNPNHKEKLLDILKSNISGEFYEIDTTDILVSISMNEQAYKTFHEQQYKKDVHFTEFLNIFLEDKLE
jgi:hypothetical protein